jgi:hypothetical protein
VNRLDPLRDNRSTRVVTNQPTGDGERRVNSAIVVAHQRVQLTTSPPWPASRPTISLAREERPMAKKSKKDKKKDKKSKKK